MTFNIKQWRSRLNITQEKAAELLGVHRVTYTNWELGKHPIEKQTQLACLACELAYIAADQYVKTYPYPSVNNGIRNFVAHSGKNKIIKAFLDEGKNERSNELSINILPKSFIQYIK